ncbi:MAG: hypothetical protein ACP5R0_03645 [Thermoplasmata archaeon]
MEINENNYMDFLYNFANNKLNETYKKYGKNYLVDIVNKLDELDFIPDDATQAQMDLLLLTAFIYYFRDPKTGKGVVDEFIEKYEMDDDLRKKFNGLKNIKQVALTLEEIRKMDDGYIGKFTVLPGHETIYVDLNVNKTYEWIGEYIGNAIIYGFVYKWNDYFRFLGIIITEDLYDDETNEEDLGDFILRDYIEATLSKIESRIINEKITLKSFIKRYTFNMIDGMYFALGFKEKMLKKDKIERIVEEITKNTEKIIKKLPKKALEELKFIYDNGGIVRYSKLKSKYGDERDIFWNEKHPESPTGILKLYGLIVVGTTVKSGRRYKMAVIPADVKPSLSQLLAS